MSLYTFGLKVLKRPLSIKTEDYTALITEYGTIFTNTGAVANVTITLPTEDLVAGVSRFGFLVDQDTLVIDPQTGTVPITNYADNGSITNAVLPYSGGEKGCFLDLLWTGEYWQPVAQIGLWGDYD